MGTRGVLSCNRKIVLVTKSEIHPPAPWGSACLLPCLQGPIPGRLEGGGSYFLRVWGSSGTESGQERLA